MTSRPVARWGRLRVSAGRLVNANSEAVILRGMSLFWSQWGGAFFSRECIARLAQDWRISVVRAPLGLIPDGYLAHPAREAARIYAVIDAAIDQDIYVIVDWHAHERHTEQACLFFADIAARYAGSPHLIFETWNEPSTADWRGEIKPYHLAVIDTIRGAHSPNVIICGTGSHCRDVDIAASDPLDRPDIAYSLHYYAGTHRAGLRERAAEAMSQGACLFVSEYGLGEATGDGILDLEEAQRWWHFLCSRGISHVNWSFFDKNESCSALQRSPPWLHFFGSHRLTPSGRAVRRYLRAANTGTWLHK